MNVIPLVKNWSFVIGRDNTTGTRTYITSSAIPSFPVSAMVPLPNMFESWNSDWSNVYVNSMSQTPINGGCETEWTIGYSSAISQGVSFPNERNYSQSLNINAGYFTYNANFDRKDNAGYKLNKNLDTNSTAIPSAHWQWSDKSLVDNIPFKAREVTMGYTYSRDMYNSTLEEYLCAIEMNVGFLNDDTFLNIASGNVLFLGADVTESTLYNDKKWNVKLQFSIKSIDNDLTTPDAWQYVFRPIKNDWEIIANAAGQRIYQYTDFNPLTAILNTEPIFPTP